MQPAYKRMQPAYDRMQGSTLENARSSSNLWIFITNGLLVDLSITRHSEHGCCWRCGLLFRGNGRSGWSP